MATQTFHLDAETATKFRSAMRGDFFHGNRCALRVDEVSPSSFELSGSKRDLRAAADWIADAKREAARTSDTATPKQIAYIETLIQRDPGTASNFGVAIVPGLTKARASQMIDQMLNG